MEIPIIYSTITGNAFKLAEAIKDDVKDAVGPYNIRWFDIVKVNLEEVETIILVYWCNRGTCDDDTIDFIKRLKNKKIVILGTLGANMESKHAKDVYERVNDLVKENNILLGHYLCRGAIDLNRTRKKLLLPESERGHLTQERFERQKESLGHPNKLELDMAKEFIRNLNL